MAGDARPARRPARVRAVRRRATTRPAALGESLEPALGAVERRRRPVADDPGREPDVETLWALIFTSGTSAAPKAVRCTQRRLLTTGNRDWPIVLDVGPDDVGYLAMPLFHSNSLMVGLAPAFVTGASVGLARRFSASRFLDDVRRYGATWFNYTGKPLAYLLATPERPDDADNPLRVRLRQRGLAARGGGGGRALRRGRRRRVRLHRGCHRPRPLRRTPRGARWASSPGITVVDPDGDERAPGRASTPTAGSLNAEECVGEIVNIEGVGPFEGYYRNDEAMARTTRNGWYWSGDLGYVDDDGWVVLRRAHLGLAAGRRRELPGRPDRGHRGPPPRRRCWRRSTACPTSTPGDQVMVAAGAARRCELRPRRLRRLGRRAAAT